MKLAQKIAINYIRAKLNILAVLSKRKAAQKALEIFSTPFRKAKKKASPLFNRAENLSFQLDGNKLRGYRWKTDSAKKILIIHGFESSSINFVQYIQPLLKKGYEVVAFDAPAHGRSEGKRIILPKYVKTISEITRLYGPFSAYLAHSFGGLALAHFLEHHPHDEETKAVLIAPATETVTAIDSFFRLLDLDEKVRKEFDQLISEKGGERPEHYSVRRAAHNIKAKILWIHDENDDVTPLSDALKVKQDDHKNLEFIITKNLGHRKIYKDPAVIKQVMDFLC